MANEPYRIKSAKIYLDGVLIGTAESGSYRITGNDEMHVTADATVSFGDGITTTEVTLNTIVTVAGKTQSITSALLQKKYVTVQVGLVDGQIHQMSMRCLEHGFDTDYRTGMLKGNARFQGGPPEVQ
jgi:hypothetical protein